MANNAVSILKKDNAIIAPFTNNLAAYDHLKKLLPDHEKTLLPSYSTCQRVLKDIGNAKAFNTSLGLFSIQRLALFKKSF